MASSRKKPRDTHSSQEQGGIEFDFVRLCEQCLSESKMADLEVVPNPQAARMNDRDRET